MKKIVVKTEKPRIIVIMMLLLITVSMSAQRRVSTSGRRFIQNVEQCSLERFWDNGAWSIGYGHRMVKGMKQYRKITKQIAVHLLNEDIKNSERIANKIFAELKWTPSQAFFDGLVSVIYNCGASGIYKTEFYKRLKACRSKNGKVNKGDFHYTVAAIKTARIPSGKYATGVKNRRQAEHRLMLS